MQSAQAAIALLASQRAATRDPLIASFQRLVTDNGITLDAASNTKANRQAFVKNARDFVLEVRSIVN
jgi:hypothetical protein